MLRAVRSFSVLSFMSEWGGSSPRKNGASSSSPAPPSPSKAQSPASPSHKHTASLDNHEAFQSPTADSPRSSRPMSMIQTYQPPVMEVSQDTLPELQRIFTFLNSHSNKLYQEGYFLKFHDTDSRRFLPRY